MDIKLPMINGITYHTFKRVFIFTQGHLAPVTRHIVILGFTAWGYGLRNNGDLWGKVFFLGFRLGILGIWFRDFMAWDLRVDIWHMGITGFWGLGFGIFWLGILG